MIESYRVALFFHLAALIAAAIASTLAHFATARQARAATVRDAAYWHGLVMSSEIVLPIAVVVFFLSGAYMIHDDGAWSWRTGWIDAGIAGTLALFTLGGFIGSRRRVLARRLEELSRSRGGAAEAPPIDALAHTISWSCAGLAIGIVAVMTIKPSLVAGLLVLCVGAAVGFAVSRWEHGAAEARTLGVTS